MMAGSISAKHKKDTVLWQIQAPHFCAGVISVKGKITETAPILNYMKGWKVTEASAYCIIKNWKFKEVKSWQQPK